ncbi:hypothetical protein [Haloferula sp. BvORR071]|uniref:hypothetical protein n=1 Tax=Haloferula sp. BvORR071 TaxID=1396141 RepID=UPI00054D7536|nr:hypothetical protein [Haloferula sp. BvORR071]
MKPALFLLFTAILPLTAQTQVPAGPEVAEAITATTPMRATEAEEVLAVSSEFIKASVAFRPDGCARTTHRIGDFHTRIEFKGLSVREIVKAPLSDTDRQAGISRRYFAHLQCEAHRIWDAPMIAWSEWHQSAYGFFPHSIIVEEIGGALKARANRIADFSPGIDASVSEAVH